MTPTDPLEAVGSVAGLRDALLASYPDLAFFGAPLIGVQQGRDIDTSPAWAWVPRLLRRRSDWWQAVGLALQQAARTGGDPARQALADLLESFPVETVPLLEWTEPLAAQWPEVRAPSAGAFAAPDHRLATIVERQRALKRQPLEVTLYDGKDGAPRVATLTSARELEASLATCSRIGLPCAPHEGPWSWLVSAACVHEWVLAALPEVCARFAHRPEPEVRALFDWFSEGFDLFRYVELLESWERSPPRWWDARLPKRKPRGWTRGPRWDASFFTYAHVAEAALTEARRQAVTKPKLD